MGRKTKTNCTWEHVVFIECYFNSYNRKEKEGKTHVITVHLRGLDGSDMTSKLWCIENEDGDVIANSIFTQMWLAKYSPSLIVKYRKALLEKGKLKDEIYDRLKEKNAELGKRLMEEKDEFISLLNSEFEGFQFGFYWQPQGLSSIGQKIDAKPASSLLNVMPISEKKRLTTIEDRSLNSFIETYRKGSIEDRTDEALDALDEFGDVFDFDDEETSEPKSESSKKESITGLEHDDEDDSLEIKF